MLSRLFIQRNIISVSIVLFLFIYYLVHMFRPSILYHNDELREFGLNRKHKTIFPAWLFSILLSVVSYLLVMYYLAFPKLYA